ncbi:hypothetical protein [Ruminococcus albus]|uniref:Uncharacterized protein n=1 Tax=Ruminococcus albus TaxID=1264 RepID=A0A1I1EAJ1_RUMAL|nr:hypothetical protein [Ruminococcus albus]SFB84144.1 hypothetical protein SAMN02910406_00628 [Ruminococcus albus]
MKKKPVIIAVCVLIVVLVRLFTPYLGRPFLIYCHGGQNGDEDFYLSSKVNKVVIYSSDDPCIKFLRYCTALEKLEVSGIISTIDINDIANPNIKELYISGYGVNWSGLNKCTDLKELLLSVCDFKSTEDISELKNLESLSIFRPKTEVSLDKLNELKNISYLEINCTNDIDCEDFSQLEKLDKLILASEGKITGLDKIDSVKILSLTMHQSDQNISRDINCEDFAQIENLEALSLETDGKIIGLDGSSFDTLKRLRVSENQLSDEVKENLKENGVYIEYLE